MLAPSVRMGFAWANGAETVAHMPKDVSVEATSACNYRCSYCSQNEADELKTPRGFMKLEHLRIILDKVKASGAAWDGIISFTHAGEPTLHPEFHEFIREANIRGWRPRFSSNAYRLTPAVTEKYLEAGEFLVSVDFSGSAAIFEKHRGKTGHWEVVRDNLAYLIEQANSGRGVTVEIVEMGGWVDQQHVSAMLADMEEALPSVKRNVTYYPRVFHNATGSVGLVQIGGQGQISTPKQQYKKCPYPWTAMIIAWNGDVHACCRDLFGKSVLGNVLEAETLEDIWNNREFQSFRRAITNKRPDDIEACRGCDLPWSAGNQRWTFKHIARRMFKR